MTPLSAPSGCLYYADQFNNIGNSKQLKKLAFDLKVNCGSNQCAICRFYKKEYFRFKEEVFEKIDSLLLEEFLDK